VADSSNLLCRIRRDVIAAIGNLPGSGMFRILLIFVDDPYSLEQLRDPRMNLSVVRPLVDKLYEANDVSMGERCSNRREEMTILST
jgi:hypothetical protein